MIIESSGGGAGGTTIRYLKLSSVANADYLLCETIDGGTTGIRVSKPYLLRQDSYDGKTINGIDYDNTGSNTRTADNGVDTPWTETIYMPYEGGDIITVAPMALNFWGDSDTATLMEISNNRVWLRAC